MAEVSTIRYEKLFEVRVLHEYYLNTNSRRSYFSLDEATRTAHLNTLLFSNRYDIWKDLSFEPSGETIKILEDLKLRFVRTKTGFMVAIKVRSSSDQTHSFVPLNGSAPLAFRIRLINPAFKSFTNICLNPTLPSAYYFSNASDRVSLEFPILSVPVDDFSSSKSYEQGEVALMGNDLMEALKRTNNADAGNWRRIDAVGIVHEGDRVLLPPVFRYRFEKDAAVKQAVFTLKSPDGTVIKTISISRNTVLQQVFVDFSTVDPSVGNAIKKGHYLLEINGDNGYNRSHNIFLDPEQGIAQDLGMVHIHFTTGDAVFDLLEQDGSLKSPAPVFEIRYKSRISFWRYRSNSGIPLLTTVRTSPFLTSENNALTTIQPMPMNAMPLEFLDQNPMTPGVFLPNPPGNSLCVEEDGRVFSDIYTSGIKDLIIEDI